MAHSNRSMPRTSPRRQRVAAVITALTLGLGLSVVATQPALADAVSREFTINGLTYTVVAGTMNVSVTAALSPSNAVVIPRSVTDSSSTYSVVAIGNLAFINKTNITSVSLPDSLTSIGDNAFQGDSALTSIVIPNSVTSIGAYAFFVDVALQSVNLGTGVRTIGDGAFMSNSALPSITIPNSVISLGNSAFRFDGRLESVSLGSGVTSIGAYAFYNDTALASITIPDSVTSIGSRAFYNNSSLTSVVMGNGLTSLGDSAFCAESALTSLTIGRGLTAIPAFAFIGATALTSLTIPDTVRSIGTGAFSGDSALASVSIGSGVTSIGTYAFDGHPAVLDVYFRGAPPATIAVADSSLTGSFGLPTGVSVHYYFAFQAPGFANGFTNSPWKGYNSVYNYTPRSISGTASVGQRLTAEIGPFSHSPAFSYQWKRNGVPISGAVGAGYTVDAADVGAKINVAITAYRTGYTSVIVTTAETATVTKGTFVASPVPTISGIVSGPPTVGLRLTAVTGSYSASPAFSYVWMRNGVAIPGAVGATYGVALDDVDKRISVEVTAYRNGFTSVVQATASTDAVAKVPFTTTPTPTISGTTTVGQTLTASAGTWSPAATLTYVWKRGGTVIVGATSSTYLLVAADATAVITVEASGSRVGYATTTRTSASTAAVTGTFVTAATPTISGTLAVGQRLTTVTGTFAPAAAFTIIWKRNGVVIPGGVGAGYTLVVDDLNAKISAEVTAYRTGYVSVVQTTSQTAAVAKGTFVASPVPTISGTATVGQRLTAVTGTYSAAPAFTYQWKSNGVAISGAVGATYGVGAADLGKKITVEVTAYRNGFTSVVQTTAETATVTR